MKRGSTRLHIKLKAKKAADAHCVPVLQPAITGVQTLINITPYPCYILEN